MGFDRSSWASIGLVLAGWAWSSLAAGAVDGSGLPSVECLRALRSARVARMASEIDAPRTTTAELESLIDARSSCQGRLEWLQAMLDHERRLGLPPEVRERVHGALASRLVDPAGFVPLTAADHLLHEPDLDPRLREAVAVAYQRAVAEQQDPSRRALGTLVRLLEDLGRLGEAAEVLERLAEIDAGETSDWSLLRIYRELERWTDAVRVTRRLVGRSRLHEALFGPQLVRLLVRSGRPEEAFQELAALEVRQRGGTLGSGPGPEFRVALAWELRDAGLDAEAEILFRQALALPERTGPSLLGELAEERGNAREEAALAVLHLYADDAERELLERRAREEADGVVDPFQLYESGTQALTSGRLEDAFGLLQRATEGLPDLEAAWHNLGLVAYRLQRFEVAAAAYTRANELNPERADGWFFQGLALVSLDRCSEALAPLETALRLDASRHLAHYHLGQCHHRLGSPEAGDRHLEAYQRSQEGR